MIITLDYIPATPLAAGFVHPGLAAAALALAAIPVIIHLINRLRHRKVPWAAMRFLMAANRRSLRRVRFEHWALLLVRMAAILLFGLAVARPLLAGGDSLGVGGTVRHRVLLLDNSLSASGDDAQSPSPAAARARQLLEAFPESDPVSLVSMAQPATVLTQQPAYDRRTLRTRIESVRPTQRASDLPGALAAVAAHLKDSPAAPGNRVVYVVSDLTRQDWSTGPEADAAVRQADRIARDDALVLVPTVSRQRDNVAITSLACRDSLRGIHDPVRIDAAISNFGSRPVRGLQLQVRVGQRIVCSPSVGDILPGQVVETPFSVQLDAPGAHIIEARLQGGQTDSATAQLGDVRYLCVEVSSSVPVLVVDGRPGPTRFSGEAGYLATALAPSAGPEQTALLSPKVISPLELIGEALPNYRLVILCNVSRLEGDEGGGWSVLEEYVANGGGLLIFTGDAVDLDSYNRFGYKQGQGLLPGRLGPPVGDPEDRESYVRLSGDDLDHRVLADFQGAEKSGLFLNGRVLAYHPVDVGPAAENAETTVLLRYTNDHPAVMEKDFGRGKVCLVTTSANMRWNNLAGRGDYVTLLWALTAYLGADRLDRLNRQIGQSFLESLEPWQASSVLSGAAVTLPDASRAEAEVRVGSTNEAPGEARHYQLRFGPLEQAGPYTVQVPKQPIRLVANIDPAESDLRILTESELKDRLDSSFTWLRPEGDDTNVATGSTQEISRTLLFMVMLLLGVEVWMASRPAAG